MDHLLTPCDNLWEILLDNFDFSWFSNGSYLKGDSHKYCAGYLTATSFDVEAASLPMAITAHQAELHTLIQACTLTCGKTAHIYIYSAYAFKVTRDFGMLWKQHGSLSYFQ